jgi:hypothetical protein
MHSTATGIFSTMSVRQVGVSSATLRQRVRWSGQKSRISKRAGITINVGLERRLSTSSRHISPYFQPDGRWT